MSAVRLFTWGYWGWGTTARQLVEAADAVEAARGFLPPVFADIRWKRQGRAADFVGGRFEALLGGERYRWLQGLGNKAIDDGGMEIARPQDAGLLLDLATAAAVERRRVVFFCACHEPKRPPRECHRCEVARLVLAEAGLRGAKAETVEWPGGEPERRAIDMPAEAFAKVRRGAKTVPLGDSPDLAGWGGLPWYSVVTVRERTGADAVAVRCGPAVYRGGWCLPVFGEAVEPDDADSLFRQSAELFARGGFAVRTR